MIETQKIDNGNIDLNIKCSNEKEAISKIYSPKLAENLLELHWSDDSEGIVVNGLITSANYNEEKKIFILFINSLPFFPKNFLFVFSSYFLKKKIDLWRMQTSRRQYLEPIKSASRTKR